MKADLLEALLKESGLNFEFYRSAGPGGQNVNKVSTAVRLRFDIRSSQLLPNAAKARLARIAGRRLTENGVLLIEARRFRTQERNRQDALQRLVDMIIKALEKPLKRIPTQPTAASRRRRIERKFRKSALKQARKGSKPTEEFE
ncbi:MAG: alternative ribosome rescue aminoacyl-tRNA hydrolase ArfB [Methylococcales bacterium]